MTMADILDSLREFARRTAKIPMQAGGRIESLALRALQIEPRFPPLFIVGAPRSGTTLPYLYLLNRFRFGYFPNIARRAPLLPVAAAMAWHWDHRTGFGHDSHYGNVDGPTAPSDGWEIFHRWFPRYAMEPVQRDRLVELRRIVGAYERIFGGPFLNKNNHNSVRIAELDRIFPNALFIHVTRNLRDAGVSLLEARRRHHVALDQWWSCPPPQYLGHQFASEADQAVRTIQGIQDYVRGSLAALDSGRWLEIRYEDFCREPEVLARWVRSHYPASNLADRLPGSAPRFDARARSDDAPGSLGAEIAAAVTSLPASAHGMQALPIFDSKARDGCT